MLYLFDTHLWCQADLPQNNFYALSKEVLVRCYFATHSEFLEGVPKKSELDTTYA